MATHEDVKEFNREINSVLATAPPISRAKMAAITKSALKAQSHYKHVVMLVEKFIAKCPAEYKVPGLYIVDSIVRQSKHNHKEKDVFGPRFARNLPTTFTHIFKCKSEDISRVIKVLNLWQMNKTFDTDVIQPLHQLAPQAPVQVALPVEQVKQSPEPSIDPLPDSPVSQPPHAFPESTNSPLLDSSIQSLLQKVTSNKTLMANLNIRDKIPLEQPEQALVPTDQFSHVDLSNHQNTSVGQSWPPQPAVKKPSRWGKEEPVTRQETYQEWSGESWDSRPPPGVHPPSTHPQTHPPTEHTRMSLEHPPHSTKKPPLLPMEQAHPPPPLEHPPPPLEHPPPPHHMEYPPPPSEHPHPSSMYEEKSKYFNTPLHQQREFTDAAYRGRPPPPPPPPLVSDQPSQFMSRPMRPGFEAGAYDGRGGPPYDRGAPGFDRSERLPMDYPRRPPPPDAFGMGPPGRYGEWSAPHPVDSRWGRWSPRRRRSRSPRPGRSGSRSPGRRSRSPRRRSRHHSRSPRRRSSRSPRRQSTSPRRPFRRRSISPEVENLNIKKADHVTVYSKTIWVGHIKGTLLKDEFKELLTEFGPVLDVEVITLRGCAYITMGTREAAKRVHKDLKQWPLPIKDTGAKPKSVEVAWAPGRGTKGSTFREFWTLKTGVSVIPWSMIKAQGDLDSIAEGGEVDIATIPPGFRQPSSDPLPNPARPQSSEEMQPPMNTGDIISKDPTMNV